SASDVRSFVQHRCLPLRQRWMTGGFPEKEFHRTDAAGMGALIGMVLYVDGVYSSAMLRATFARLTEPQPTALWRAFMEAVSEADTLQLSPLSEATQVWLPSGQWRIETEDKKASLQQGKTRWQATQSVWRLPRGGWYLLKSAASLRLVKDRSTASQRAPGGAYLYTIAPVVSD
ncbi:MAG: hypothetical protein RMM08_11060, partial [Armatimonadota bacterium]|nr:hypothetical protein [bacterium]MDW8321889.1 hypothetical protein [Armatimonadota bacterium]